MSYRTFVVIFFVFMFSSRFMLFPTFLETYKTHKQYRTHELTTYVIYSSSMKTANLINQEATFVDEKVSTQ